MDELITLFTKGIGAIIAAKNAKDDAAQAAALADLDSVIALVAPVAASVPAEIAANKAEALANLAKRFPAAEAIAAAKLPPPAADEPTKP